MNFQIVNVPAPNSVRNTCVFTAFEAVDTPTNLDVALSRCSPVSVQGGCGDHEQCYVGKVCV